MNDTAIVEVVRELFDRYRAAVIDPAAESVFTEDDLAFRIRSLDATYSPALELLREYVSDETLTSDVRGLAFLAIQSIAGRWSQESATAAALLHSDRSLYLRLMGLLGRGNR